MALEKYNKMRDFSKTPEPSGKAKRTKSRKLQFVIQKHNATRLHYDFRLEHDGVLLSWAVPKGPSLNPADKRLAVQTEDHPFEYRKFEGLIPKGEYGGGEVIIWDKGTFYPEHNGEAVKDIDEAEKLIKQGMRKGTLKFVLEGEKLHGSWALVKLKNKEKDWLLIKHKDEHALFDREVIDEDESVVSGKTIEDLQEEFGTKPEKKKVASKSINAKSRTKSAYPPVIQPMLASLAPEPFSKDGWIYEPKLDGIRAIAYVYNGDVRLLSRRGLDLTGRYPVLTDALAEQEGTLVLDGEIVAFDTQGRPSFQLLQQRSGLSRNSDVKQAEGTIPIQYYAFDILYRNGSLLVGKPLSERKAELKEALKQSDSIHLVDKIQGTGDDAYRACVQNGLEGILAKRADSLYEVGKRSKSWLKIKATRSDDFVVCGYTLGNGSRSNLFGAIILGYYRDDELKYAGSVGTGFNEKSMRDLLKTMKGLETKTCPFNDKAICKLKAIWLKPVMVAQVKYAELTRDMILRIPVFQHLRSDIDPKQAGPNPIVKPESTGDDQYGAEEVRREPIQVDRKGELEKKFGAGRMPALPGSKQNRKGESGKKIGAGKMPALPGSKQNRKGESG
ncbi:MAG: non-homologous end-joining DNA ligase, partial [Candidatus Obscuribacterales bacterium]|nr:non-homologous end-joining DNA ligase [Candidatus Obscuribacterales bacterium]